jgi:hypothetical protein
MPRAATNLEFESRGISPGPKSKFVAARGILISFSVRSVIYMLKNILKPQRSQSAQKRSTGKVKHVSGRS